MSSWGRSHRSASRRRSRRLAFRDEYGLIHQTAEDQQSRCSIKLAMHRAKLIFTALLIAGLATVAYFLIQQSRIEADRPRATLDAYLRATYARNFAVAYDYLSSADRQVRTRQNYIDSQGGYSGFTLEVARQLAGFMEIWSIDRKMSGGRLIMKVGYRVPAPAELNELLLQWDEDALERPLHGRAKRNRCRTNRPQGIRQAAQHRGPRNRRTHRRSPKAGRSTSTGLRARACCWQANYPTAIGWTCASPPLK